MKSTVSEVFTHADATTCRNKSGNGQGSKQHVVVCQYEPFPATSYLNHLGLTNLVKCFEN